MKSTLNVLLFCVFLDLFGVGLVIPMYPQLSKKLGVSNSGYGLLMSLYGIAQFFGSGFMGAVSDRRGRKAVLLVNCIGTSVAYLLLTVAALRFNPLLFALSRIVVGLVKQTSTVATAYVADITCAAGRSTSLASLSSVIHLGLIAGPILSGIAQGIFGDHFPSMFASLIFLIDFVVIMTFLPEAVQNKSQASSMATQVKDLFLMLRGPKSRHLLLCSLAYHSCQTIIHTTFVLTLESRFQLKPKHIAYTLSYHSLLSVFVQSLAVYPATQWFRESTLLMGTSLLSALCYAGEAVAPTYVWYIVALTLNAIPMGVFRTCFTSKITKSFPSETMGGALGAFGTVESLARIVIPALSGIMLDNLGAMTPMLISSLLSIVLGLLLQLDANQKAD